MITIFKFISFSTFKILKNLTFFFFILSLNYCSLVWDKDSLFNEGNKIGRYLHVRVSAFCRNSLKVCLKSPKHFEVQSLVEVPLLITTHWKKSENTNTKSFHRKEAHCFFLRKRKWSLHQLIFLCLSLPAHVIRAHSYFLCCNKWLSFIRKHIAYPKTIRKINFEKSINLNCV